MPLKLEDIIDVQQFQMLQDRLNEVYSFPSAIIDNEGKVLTATAWQDMCTKFHRQHSECLKECIKSDQYIADHLHEANPTVSYRCPHGLIDNATPIIIEDVHYGNYFTGQFFLEPPDLNFFRAQAKRYGFDEEAYIEAVNKVPIWTQEQLNSYLFFIKGLIEVISGTGLKNLKEIEAKKKMEESEENASTILRQIQEGFWITMPQGGQIIDVNEAMCSMLGYTRDEMFKMSVADVEVNDSQEAIERTIQDVIHTGSAHFESRFRRKDNAIIDVDVSITYLPKRNLFFGFHRDISARKRMENALRESEERYRVLLSESPDPIFSFTPEGQYKYANQAFADGVGKPADEITGKSIWDVFSKDEADKRFAALSQVFRSGEKRVIEVCVPRTDGDQYYITSISPIKDAEGKILSAICSSKDITEHKRAEEAIKQSEEKFSKAFEASPEAITIASMEDGRYIEVNEVFLKKTGFQRDDVIGHTSTELGVWDDPNERLKFIEELSANGFLKNFDTRYKMHNGEVRDFLVSSEVIEIDRKQCSLNFILDITERKQAEEALRESEERYRMIFNNSPLGIMHFDANGIIVDMNDNFAQIMGGTREKIIGFNMLEKLQDQVMIKAVKDALNGRMGYYEGDYISITAGKTTPMRAIYQSITTTDGKFLGAVGLFEDIGERKQAEEALRESESQFRSYVENAPIGVFVCDEKGRYLQVNPAATTITGYSSEELLTLSIPDILPPESQVLAAQYFQVVAETGRVSAEFAFKHKHGKIGMWSLEGVRLSPTRFMGLVTDITERKDAEEEKAILQEQLLQAQKLEAVGQLAGGVAHDFNNMLGVIIGHAEIAMDKMDTGRPPLSDLQEIRNAAQRSADLTRQLLTFARKQVVVRKVLDLNETVAGMLNMLQRLIGEDINMAWLPGVNLWPINVDPSQIDQLLANLCVNARDAIAGVGKVTIETKNISFDEEYCADHADFVTGAFVLLVVSDDGCGMDKETTVKIFEPFFTTKGVGKGTGLGLATVYGIIKQNNGFINVYSEPDQGTTFKIYLPRHIGNAEQARTEAAVELLRRGQETILLVEDEPTLLELSKLLLEAQGYQVLSANTPGEAIRLAGEHTGDIHLLMTDVVMPEMNGQELARKMLSLSPHLKCLFTSGYTADVIAHHGVLDEGIYFIQKPFSRKDLATKVREVLDNK